MRSVFWCCCIFPGLRVLRRQNGFGVPWGPVAQNHKVFIGDLPSRIWIVVRSGRVGTKVRVIPLALWLVDMFTKPLDEDPVAQMTLNPTLRIGYVGNYSSNSIAAHYFCFCSCLNSNCLVCGPSYAQRVFRCLIYGKLLCKELSVGNFSLLMRGHMSLISRHRWDNDFLAQSIGAWIVGQ